MSKRKELKQRFAVLTELAEIMTAMKSLAYMETKKLAGSLADQGRGLDSIRAAARDFLTFYPFLLSDVSRSAVLLIALGADRGFCGNFNELVAERVKRELEEHPTSTPSVIAVGDRLASRLDRAVALSSTISGASVSEEVPDVLSNLSSLVSEYYGSSGGEPIRMKIVAHTDVDQVAVIEPLLELEGDHTEQRGSPPCLTLPPSRFFFGLIDHYFRAVLYHSFYGSLMSESTKRIIHLDSALRRLDKDTEELQRQYNRARQEEITQEIELLMLNLKETESRQG